MNKFNIIITQYRKLNVHSIGDEWTQLRKNLIFLIVVILIYSFSITWDRIWEEKWFKFLSFLILFVMNNGIWDGYTTHACMPHRPPRQCRQRTPIASCTRAASPFFFLFILINSNFDQFSRRFQSRDLRIVCKKLPITCKIWELAVELGCSAAYK